MLALHQELVVATIPANKQLYQRQIEATDRQIDGLIYELYDQWTVIPAGALSHRLAD